MHTCLHVVDYLPEPPGSDVADPRVRCGRPATHEVEPGHWLCDQHANEWAAENSGSEAGVEQDAEGR